MINQTLTKNITNITELKKNPVAVADSESTCVLNNGKPCFYTISPKKMESLSKFLNFSGENEELLLDTIISEMTPRDLEALKEDGLIRKDTFSRIVISLAVNFSDMSSLEEIVRSLEV